MDVDGRGLIPRAIEDIYDYIFASLFAFSFIIPLIDKISVIANPSSSSSQFLVRASYLQVLFKRSPFPRLI